MADEPGSSGIRAWDGRIRDVDLWIVVGLVGTINVLVLLPIGSVSPLRAFVALPFLLFVPGYAVTAALFVEEVSAPVHGDSGADTPDNHRLPLLERILLGLGMSVLAVTAVGLLLDLVGIGFRLVPLLAGISLVTLFAAVLARKRRRQIAASNHYTVTMSGVTDSLRSVFGDGSRRDTALSLFVVFAVLLAVTAIYVGPVEDEPAHSVSLLTEDGDQLVAGDYPDELTQDEGTELFLAVENGGNEPTTATVVIVLQNVSASDEELEVTEQTELDRFEAQVQPNERELIEHEVTPTVTGDRLRLAYLVYFDERPETPSSTTADRQVHLWVTVSSDD